MEISGLLGRTADLYNNKLFSDVEYRLRDKDGQITSFYAHKLILAMAGEGFAKIFYGPKREQSTHRKITEFTPHVFGLMLRYIYTDKIKFADLGDAMIVFQLATCLSIKDLMIECDLFLTQYQVDTDSVFARYDCALVFQNRVLLETCRKLVSNDTKAVFKSPYFCKASKLVIEDILKLDRFSVSSELEVIESVLRWCKADCNRRNVSSEYSLCLRDSFLPFCRNLRFLTLDIQEFLDFVENNISILTEHEKEVLTATLLGINDRKLIPKEFSISQILRCVNLGSISSAIGSVKGLDSSRANSSNFYAHTNGDSNLMKTSPNRSQPLRHFSGLNGTNDFNQALNNTVEKSNQILSFTAQSNGNFMKPSVNVKQASTYSSQLSDPTGFMKTGPNNNHSLSVSSPVNGANNSKQSYTTDRQTYSFSTHSNGPREINDYSNSTNAKVLAPARSTYSSYVPESSPANSNNGPQFEVLPKRKHTPTLRVMPQPATKDLAMSYEFQLYETPKQISSSCDSDVKCHVDIKMLKGTIFIHGIELKVKENNKSHDDEDIEVHLCITNDDSPKSYSQKVKPHNDLLLLPFGNPVTVSPSNPVDIEVMIEDLKMHRCSVCRTQESRCELNSGLDVTAKIVLQSNQSNGNDSFFFLISKILYSVPRY